METPQLPICPLCQSPLTVLNHYPDLRLCNPCLNEMWAAIERRHHKRGGDAE